MPRACSTTLPSAIVVKLMGVLQHCGLQWWRCVIDFHPCRLPTTDFRPWTFILPISVLRLAYYRTTILRPTYYHPTSYILPYYRFASRIQLYCSPVSTYCRLASTYCRLASYVLS
jgi:hypothetical protein